MILLQRVCSSFVGGRLDGWFRGIQGSESVNRDVMSGGRFRASRSRAGGACPPARVIQTRYSTLVVWVWVHSSDFYINTSMNTIQVQIPL
jgi:hypothetical protein